MKIGNEKTLNQLSLSPEDMGIENYSFVNFKRSVLNVSEKGHSNIDLPNFFKEIKNFKNKINISDGNFYAKSKTINDFIINEFRTHYEKEGNFDLDTSDMVSEFSDLGKSLNAFFGLKELNKKLTEFNSLESTELVENKKEELKKKIDNIEALIFSFSLKQPSSARSLIANGKIIYHLDEIQKNTINKEVHMDSLYRLTDSFVYKSTQKEAGYLSGSYYEDCLSAGRIGLLKAIHNKKFDRNTHFFLTFAGSSIRQEIQKELTRNKTSITLPNSHIACSASYFKAYNEITKQYSETFDADKIKNLSPSEKVGLLRNSKAPDNIEEEILDLGFNMILKTGVKMKKSTYRHILSLSIGGMERLDREVGSSTNDANSGTVLDFQVGGNLETEMRGKIDSDMLIDNIKTLMKSFSYIEKLLFQRKTGIAILDDETYHSVKITFTRSQLNKDSGVRENVKLGKKDLNALELMAEDEESLKDKIKKTMKEKTDEGYIVNGTFSEIMETYAIKTVGTDLKMVKLQEYLGLKNINIKCWQTLQQNEAKVLNKTAGYFQQVLSEKKIKIDKSLILESIKLI